jgi:7-keto-8-aminopelargonate synthetase-like enzyme
MADLFDRCVHFRKEQRIASAEELEVVERVLFSVSPVDNAGPWIEMNGRRYLQFGTNDYLGMSVHPAVRAAAEESIRRHGIGAPMGARPLTGTCELHVELEARVAAFKRKEAALVFTMGAGAMMGMIAGLARPSDLIILDQLAHASLVCGAKISGASLKYFRHNDPQSLERVLAQARPEQPRLVVIDGVYSMNGDIAPLPEICDLCERHGARLLVDDAHGNGVLGEDGRGAAEVAGVEDRIDIHAGTFSKAFGTSGGFVAASKDVIFYVRTLAPTMLFTKAPSACVTSATLVSLDLVEKARDRRATLRENADYLQTRLRDRGYDLGVTETPITPIRLGGNNALFVADILRRKYDILVPAVLYPAVRRGAAIVRVIPTALHTREDLDRLVDSLDRAVAEHAKNQAARALPSNNGLTRPEPRVQAV